MLKALALALFIIVSLSSEGSAQSKRYDVISYQGTIFLDRQDTFIQGHVKMSAICTTDAPVDRVLQHLIYLDIDSVFVNGERATIDWTGKDSGEYYVVPPASMLIPGHFTVETYYHGKPLPEQTDNKWGGVSNRGNMMFAMGVGFQAPYISCTRHWLPCYDLPDDKADSARLTFISKNPADVIAASGHLDRVFDTLNGRAYEWSVMHPIASYLLTFAQGPFETLKIDNPLNVEFEAYAFAADTARTRRLMDKRVVRGLQFFDSLFAPYPFEKVGYVVAPIGSMEHQTMITLDRRTIDTNQTTAVHELAHMWWGDLVTCQTFADPWLNEGFARFCESLYLERFEGEQAYRKRQWSNIQSAKKNGSDYPMYGAPYHTNHENNYPGAVIYDKGAAVLGMLRYAIGDEQFFAALRSYLTTYSYSTATSYDLWEHFEKATNQDLDWFFQKWVFEKGYPKLEISYLPGTTNEIRVKQSSSSGFFRLPIMVEGTMKTGEKIRRVIYTDSAEISYLTLEFSGYMTESLSFDPDSVLIADLNVVRAGVSGRKSTSLTLWPNPASTQLQVKNIQTQDLGSQVLLFDTSGMLRLTTTLSTLAANSIPVASLPSGSYRVVIENDGQLILSEQVIVQH